MFHIKITTIWKYTYIAETGMPLLTSKFQSNNRLPELSPKLVSFSGGTEVKDSAMECKSRMEFIQPSNTILIRINVGNR